MKHFIIILLYCCFTMVSAQTAKHEHHQEEPIQLNNGKKWKVHKNMIQYIRDMEKETFDFEKRTKSFETINVAEYQVLGNILNARIQLLTSNCTMTGQAHDELHKWLLPYIHSVEELTAAKTASEAQNIFNQMKTSWKTFNTYFQ